MKTNRKSMTRTIGLTLAVVMLMSCAFVVLGGLVAAAETMTTLYLNPASGRWQDGTTTSKHYSQAPGTTFTPTETPIRDGWTFTGWQLSGTSGSWDGTTFTFGSASCSLTAQWEQIQTMLTLDPNGGTWPDGTTQSKQFRNYMGSIYYTASMRPSRDGYQFQCWVLQSGSGGSLNASTGAFTYGDADCTLKAMWTANTYLLTAKPGYGVWLPYTGTQYASALSSEKVYDGITGSTVDIPILSPTQYFRVTGWTLLPGATGTLLGSTRYQFGTSNDTAVPQIGIDNNTVYLNPGAGSWKNANTGPVSGDRYLFFDRECPVMIQVNGVSKMAYHLPDLDDLSKTDYTFAGWTKTSGSGTVVQQGPYDWFYVFDTSQSGEPMGGAHLTAQWTIRQVTLSLQNVPQWKSGTQWANNGGTITVNAGTTVPLPDASVVSHEGCTFTGWYLDNSFHGVLTPTGSPITSITLHENTELCAGWAPNTYTLTLDLNGGGVNHDTWYDPAPLVFSGEYQGPAYAVGHSVAFPGIYPDVNGLIVRRGYTFSGWVVDGTLSGRIFTNTQNGETYYNYQFGAGNDTLIAQWTLYNYTVTFDANGGDPVEDLSFTIDTTVVLPAANRSGYRFLGWKPVPDSQNHYDFWAAKYADRPFCWDEDTVYPAGTALNGKYAGLHMQAQWEEIEDKVSVTIGDQISVNLLLNLDARNAQNVTVVYKDLNGDEKRETFTDFSSLQQVDGGLYKIAVQIAPAQIADTVTVYIDGETLDACVKDYCNTLVAGDYTPEVVALAQAVLDYGQAANNFFNYTDETISAVTNLSADDAKAWTPVLSDTTGKVRSISFMALTKPEFRFYMKDMTEAEAAALNKKITVSGVSGVAARFVKNVQGNILLEVTGLKAEDVDETITVTIDGLGTITFAGNDFAYLMANNAATEALGAALYAYGAAAKACFG